MRADIVGLGSLRWHPGNPQSCPSQPPQRGTGVDCGFLDSSAPRERRDRYQWGATGSTPRGAPGCWWGGEASARRSLASRRRRAVAEAIVLHREAGIGKTALLEYATQAAPGLGVLRTTGNEAEWDLRCSSQPNSTSTGDPLEVDGDAHQPRVREEPTSGTVGR